MARELKRGGLRGLWGFFFSAEMGAFPTMLDEVLESRASMLLRMRLQCRVVRTDDGEAVSSVENESDSESPPAHARMDLCWDG